MILSTESSPQPREMGFIFIKVPSLFLLVQIRSVTMPRVWQMRLPLRVTVGTGQMVYEGRGKFKEWLGSGQGFPARFS